MKIRKRAAELIIANKELVFQNEAKEKMAAELKRQQVPCIIEIKSQLIKNKVELIFTGNGMGIDLQKKGDQVFG